MCEGPSHSQPRDVFDVLLQLEAQLQVLRLQPEVLFLDVLLSLRRGAGAASRRLREFQKGGKKKSLTGGLFRGKSRGGGANTTAGGGGRGGKAVPFWRVKVREGRLRLKEATG